MGWSRGGRWIESGNTIRRLLNDIPGQHVMFLLRQYTPLYHNLGRFRLSITSACGPHRAQRPAVIEPALK